MVWYSFWYIFHDELKFINHSNVSKKWWRMNQWEQPDQPSDKPLFKIIQPVEIYFRHQENHESRKTTNKWKCHAIRLFNRLSWNWVIQSFQFGWLWSYFDVRHGCSRWSYHKYSVVTLFKLSPILYWLYEVITIALLRMVISLLCTLQ